MSEPIFSSPLLHLDRYYDGRPYCWLSGHNGNWLCAELLGDFWEIPLKTEKIRVHAYTRSPHVDALKITIMPNPAGGPYWVWDAYADPTSIAGIKMSDFYIPVGNALKRNKRIQKLMERNTDGRVTLYAEVEIIK